MNKRRNHYILFVILWLVLFIFSTDLILLATGNRLQQESIDTTVLSPNIRFNIERFSSPEGILGVVNFEGWALNTTYKADSQKKVSLILKTDNHAYELSTVEYARPDVSAEFKELNLSPEGLGFTGSLSTTAIKSGTYELFIKLWEIGETAEIMNTGKIYHISGLNLFEEAKIVGQLLPGMNNLEVTDRIKGYVDKCKVSGDHVIIDGWAYLQGNNAAEDSVQLLMKDAKNRKIYYAVEKYERPDVSSYFGDENYVFSGFRLNALIDQELTKPFSISVIINNHYISKVEFSCP